MMNEQKTPLRVCYFGIYDPEFSRNAIYIRGLKENGVEVIECNDKTPGMRKYLSLVKKHWNIRNSYDVLVVGYPGQILVPLAKLISRKPVVLDALCSLYESLILSRDAYKGNPLRVPVIRFIDWLAYTCADKILVETEKQKMYFENNLHVPSKKCAVVYTGVDDEKFFADEKAEKFSDFTVLFRGRIVKEAGVPTVLEAAKILEGKGVQFLIIGFGWDDAMKEFDETMKRLSPKNVRHIRKQVPISELRDLMQKCHISLGQFGDHERLSRTIPHKAFESLVMRIPYVTVRAEGVMELLHDKENCIMVNPADPKDLAEKILVLKNGTTLREKLADNGYQTYQKQFTSRILGAELLRILKRVLT